MTAFEQRVLEGFAGLIANNSAATIDLTFDASGVPYTAGQIGIFIDRWPESPDGAVTITDYTVSDDMSLSDSVIGVQVTIRHRDIRTVKAIADDVFNLIHGHQAGMMGTITLVSARRASGTNTGQDSNERQGRIENYYLTVHRPSTNRS